MMKFEKITDKEIEQLVEREYNKILLNKDKNISKEQIIKGRKYEQEVTNKEIKEVLKSLEGYTIQIHHLNAYIRNNENQGNHDLLVKQLKKKYLIIKESKDYHPWDNKPQSDVLKHVSEEALKKLEIKIILAYNDEIDKTNKGLDEYAKERKTGKVYKSLQKLLQIYENITSDFENKYNYFETVSEINSLKKIKKGFEKALESGDQWPYEYLEGHGTVFNIIVDVDDLQPGDVLAEDIHINEVDKFMYEQENKKQKEEIN